MVIIITIIKAVSYFHKTKGHMITGWQKISRKWYYFDPKTGRMQKGWEFETAELTKIIDTFINGLPDTERRMFICRYWYLDQISAISKQFGFTQSKVKSILYRTRKKLLKYLEQEGVFL